MKRDDVRQQKRTGWLSDLGTVAESLSACVFSCIKNGIGGIRAPPCCVVPVDGSPSCQDALPQLHTQCISGRPRGEQEAMEAMPCLGTSRWTEGGDLTSHILSSLPISNHHQNPAGVSTGSPNPGRSANKPACVTCGLQGTAGVFEASLNAHPNSLSNKGCLHPRVYLGGGVLSTALIFTCIGHAVGAK